MESKPWAEWLNRDDRKILAALAERNWSTPFSYKSLSPLRSIVTSLHFSSHSRWGVDPSANQLKKLCTEFLDWMRNQGEWTQLQKAWAADRQGPWSMPFAVSRAYLRFMAANYAEILTPEKSEWARPEWSLQNRSEMPEPVSGVHQLRYLTDPILDVFASLTHRLPTPIRLSYQLHLEGLLNDEIAAVLNLSAAQVEQHIQEAKGELVGSIKKGETGT